jgi:hypothetical protein
MKGFSRDAPGTHRAPFEVMTLPASDCARGDTIWLTRSSRVVSENPADQP